MTATRRITLSRKNVYAILHVAILLLSLFLVTSISVDTFRNETFYEHPINRRIDLWICILFLVDFVVEYRMATNKRRYLLTHFVLLLVAIPYLDIIALLHLEMPREASYIIRFVPLLRGGYALAIIINWLTSNKATGLFLTYILLLTSTVYFSSLIFYIAEHNKNVLVEEYTDALWWALMDVTTVGSNITAVTPIGRVLSVVVAALGMMMFPIFTVYITSLIERRNKGKAA